MQQSFALRRCKTNPEHTYTIFYTIENIGQLESSLSSTISSTNSKSERFLSEQISMPVFSYNFCTHWPFRAKFPPILEFSVELTFRNICLSKSEKISHFKEQGTAVMMIHLGCVTSPLTISNVPLCRNHSPGENIEHPGELFVYSVNVGPL